MRLSGRQLRVDFRPDPLALSIARRPRPCPQVVRLRRAPRSVVSSESGAVLRIKPLTDVCSRVSSQQTTGTTPTASAGSAWATRSTRTVAPSFSATAPRRARSAWRSAACVSPFSPTALPLPLLSLTATRDGYSTAPARSGPTSSAGTRAKSGSARTDGLVRLPFVDTKCRPLSPPY